MSLSSPLNPRWLIPPMVLVSALALAAPPAPQAAPLSASVTPAAQIVPPSGAPQPRLETRYILAGGGSSPVNTQVSLEEHLRRFQLVLESRQVPAHRRTLLFADGQTTTPVIEISDKSPGPPDLQDELALIMNRTDNRGVTWRPTQLTGLAGPANRARLKAALEAPGTTGRTVLYFAGHGTQNDHTGDVSLGLWENERLSPAELADWLEPLPAEHRVAVVLAQCHSGGFGSYIYRDGNPKRGFDAHDRCGFFAAPADFVSAGCTPEANRANPDDYSTWFIAALTGQMPNGKPLPSEPDINRDARVTMDEAHAFARIHDGTLDVPVSSSEYFLRTETAELEPSDTLTLAAPFATLLKQARPADRRVLEVLSTELKLASDPAAGLKARYQADRLLDEQDRLSERADAVDDRQDKVRDNLKRDLIARWPWLGNPYHPKALDIQARDGAAIQQLLTNSPDRATYNKLQQEKRAFQNKADELEPTWARWERLARAAEIVVMESHLRAKGTPAQVEKLEALLRCEGDPL